MGPEFSLLPPDLIGRASLRGQEYAWVPDDIPALIEAAHQANLVNIGGQLQFRFSGGETCECYWVQVDTYKSVSKLLPWPERVRLTAEVAHEAFSKLPSDWDFAVEGRKAFGDQFGAVERIGEDPMKSACFVWYILSEERAAAKNL